MKHVLLLGSQHGDEPLGDVLYTHIRVSRPELLPYVTFLIGNPRAKRAGVRYTESDLNRSYHSGAQTYEQRRAAKLLGLIRRQGYSLVLDLHTTTCVQPPSLITGSVDSPELLPFLRACSIERIVHMRHPMVRSSLIGSCSQAISVEVSVQSLTSGLMDQLCDDIARYLEDATAVVQRTVYEVNEVLLSSEVTASELLELENFVPSKRGFTPVLVGEKGYRTHTKYSGFKAHKVYQIRV